MIQANFKEQSPEEILQRLKRKEHIEILDVRELEEWMAGHIPQAKHIPLSEIPYRMKEIDPNRETIIVCRSGNRSGMACEFLAQQGYHVVNMAGGMLEWTGEIKTGR
ncbi:rhodanese-like domain-containing protein [Microaerobacter geothermalis]|uniref:rhodanese-like domain-containing protein n=1 Tax=Microaerobacter geothermalis TaxID=674972 RepID=UPI0038B29F1D